MPFFNFTLLLPLKQKNLPVPPIIPLFLIAGYHTKIVASLLALFVLTVTFIFHSHHIFTESLQLTIFLKNFAIFGGLLVLIANKPQICSVDYYLKFKKGN